MWSFGYGETDIEEWTVCSGQWQIWSITSLRWTWNLPSPEWHQTIYGQYLFKRIASLLVLYSVQRTLAPLVYRDYSSHALYPSLLGTWLTWISKKQEGSSCYICGIQTHREVLFPAQKDSAIMRDHVHASAENLGLKITYLNSGLLDHSLLLSLPR